MPDEIILQSPQFQRHDEPAFYTEDQLAEKYGVKAQDHDWKVLTKRVLKKQFQCSGQTAKDFAKRTFPPLDWVPNYKIRENLIGDIVAGLTIAVIHLPQGMAYGILSSLPAVTGLYVSFFPVLIYVLFGTSRQVSIGTFAVVSLMVAQVINEMVTPCPTEAVVDDTTAAATVASTATVSFETSSTYTETTSATNQCETALNERKMELAVALAMANGIIQVAMSILRLGIITTYLSTHLISGFTCGAAFHVLTSQAPKLLGISVPRFTGPLALVYSWIELFKKITTINWATVIISVVCILFLVVGKKINERFHDRLPIPPPWELGVVIFGTIAAYFGNFNSLYGVQVVGEIPTGIEVSVPKASDIGATMLGGFPIAIVAFATEISLSEMFATKHSYKLDSNQELLAMGLGNMFGSFFSCYPSAASLSRSAICNEVGAKTQLNGIFSSALILVILLWIGPLFESLPQAALASIIVVNLKGLLKQFEKIPPLWRVSKLDALTWVVTWTSVVLLGVSLGLGVAVAFQVFTLVLNTQFVKGYNLGQLKDTGEYRNVLKYHTEENEHPNIIVFRFPAPLIFANAKNFRSQVCKSLGYDPTLVATPSGKTVKPLKSDDFEPRENPSFVDGDDAASAHEQEISPSFKSETNGGVALASNGITARTEFPATTDLHATETQVFSIDRKKNVTHFVFDMSCCPFIDNDGAKTIKAMHLSFLQVDVKFFLASCSADVRRVLTLTSGQERPPLFTSVSSAMAVARGDVVLEFDDIGNVVSADGSDRTDTRL